MPFAVGAEQNECPAKGEHTSTNYIRGEYSRANAAAEKDLAGVQLVLGTHTTALQRVCLSVHCPLPAPPTIVAIVRPPTDSHLYISTSCSMLQLPSPSKPIIQRHTQAIPSNDTPGTGTCTDGRAWCNSSSAGCQAALLMLASHALRRVQRVISNTPTFCSTYHS